MPRQPKNATVPPAAKMARDAAASRTLLIPAPGGFVPIRSAQPAGDSGMVTAFRSARHTKPEQAGLLARLTARWRKATGYEPGEATTEQGAAGAASPATYQLTLYQQRYDRRATIAECRQMFIDDSRTRRSVQMYANEAVRGGVNITVNTGGRGTTGQRARIAQEEARRVKALVDRKLRSWGTMLLCEGDLFVQAVLTADPAAPRLVDALRMPAVAIERLTDDADRFIDPLAAFEQVDVATNATVARFPLALMYHARWDHTDGERYGEPCMVAGRRKRRLLELQEEAQAIRRLTRAPKRNLFNIGTKDNAQTAKAVEEFRDLNGLQSGEKQMLDPNNVAMDYFGNGLVTVTSIDSDAGVSDIADLEYAQNVLVSTALPTPGVLFNLDTGAGRDVVKDVRGEWLKSTYALSDILCDVVRFLFELALLVRGVHPDTVDYVIHFPESSLETPQETVDKIIKLRRNIIGLGPSAMPDPLVSKKRAVQLLADILDIPDVDAELALIDAELRDTNAKQLDLQKTQFAQQKSQAVEMLHATGDPAAHTKLASSQGKGSFGQASSAPAAPKSNAPKSNAPSHTGPRTRPVKVKGAGDAGAPSQGDASENIAEVIPDYGTAGEPEQWPVPRQTVSGPGTTAAPWNAEYGMETPDPQA